MKERSWAASWTTGFVTRTGFLDVNSIQNGEQPSNSSVVGDMGKVVECEGEELVYEEEDRDDLVDGEIVDRDAGNGSKGVGWCKGVFTLSAAGKGRF